MGCYNSRTNAASKLDLDAKCARRLITCRPFDLICPDFASRASRLDDYLSSSAEALPECMTESIETLQHIRQKPVYTNTVVSRPQFMDRKSNYVYFIFIR